MLATTGSVPHAPGSVEINSVLRPGDSSPLCTFPLTRGYSAVIDAHDLARVSALRWCANVCSGGVYAFRMEGSRGVYLHRWLLGVTGPKIYVDHANRDTLDYRRHNLRVATPSQSSANRVAPPNQHGFLGVHTRGDGWVYGRVRSLGRFHNTASFREPLDAAIARDSLALRLHGEFAVLNFPQAVSA